MVKILRENNRITADEILTNTLRKTFPSFIHIFIGDIMDGIDGYEWTDFANDMDDIGFADALVSLALIHDGGEYWFDVYGVEDVLGESGAKEFFNSIGFDYSNNGHYEIDFGTARQIEQAALKVVEENPYLYESILCNEYNQLPEDEKENNADFVEVINYFKRKRQDELDNQNSKKSKSNKDAEEDYGF